MLDYRIGDNSQGLKKFNKVRLFFPPFDNQSAEEQMEELLSKIGKVNWIEKDKVFYYEEDRYFWICPKSDNCSGEDCSKREQIKVIVYIHKENSWKVRIFRKYKGTIKEFWKKHKQAIIEQKEIGSEMR